MNFDFDALYKLSDLTQEEYNNIKEKYLPSGQSNNLLKYLKSHCRLPNLRNTVRPVGEIYAPVYYDKDCIIKFINKPSWGKNGILVTITLWDLLVIDIDDREMLPFVSKKIQQYYPDELFYIHETPRGYHIFMLSRTVNHASKYAIYARKKLYTDPAHGTNSLYVGSSLRLTRKTWEEQSCRISVYHSKIGNGQLDPEAERLYNVVTKWLSYFHSIEQSSLVRECYNIWKELPNNFGFRHIYASAPYILCSDGIVPNIGQLTADQTISKLWKRFMKYKTIDRYNLYPLLLCVQYQMGFDNLYRILEATAEYAVGVHVQHNTYFISYRDLLFIDYDSNRLGILARYVRRHPEYVFRVVKSPKGYHAFLTSHYKPHNDMDSIDMLLELRSDPAHILGVYHRGYSVRINKKRVDEPEYREYTKYGKGKELPELVGLYNKHLELYKKYDKGLTCHYQLYTSNKILKEEGLQKIY